MRGLIAPKILANFQLNMQNMIEAINEWMKTGTKSTAHSLYIHVILPKLTRTVFNYNAFINFYNYNDNDCINKN